MALALLTGLGAAGAAPASAVEVVGVRLPLLGEILTARTSELRSAEALWAGDSDLAELDRATDGRIARAIANLVHEPLPQQDFQSSAMVQQLEVLLSQLVQVDQLPGRRLDAKPVVAAMERLRAGGQEVTLLNVLAEIPASKVTIRLDRALPVLQDLKSDKLRLEAQLARYPMLPSATDAALRSGPAAIRTSSTRLQLDSGRETLEVVVVRPTGAATLPPVVISHGLWDSPDSFLGWAQHLASHGAPVFLPRHPGSDISQQAEMLAGRTPPPDPSEFLRRPADVRAVLDALDRGSLAGGEGVKASGVVMIGHSWGGTTALQLAGARSLPAPLWSSCSDAASPQRNLSWVLQCSFLPAATPQSQADPRIARVVAVSPPQGLVFEQGVKDLQVPVLLVSGSSDFVVPTEPEALVPFALFPGSASRLVVAERGSHFNLPAGAASNGGPLRALLLRWVNQPAVAPDSGLTDPKGLPLRLVPASPLRP